MTALGAEGREAILAIAHRGLSRALGLPAAPPAAAGLAALRVGIFVSWTVDGERRGSMGQLEPAGDAAKEVAALAVRAAFEDPRVAPITAAEAARARCAVALCGPAHPIARAGEIDPARHGLSVVNGAHAAVLLPGAAATHGWDASTYLKHTCLRAGLRADAAALPGTRVLAFEVLEVGDVIGTAG